VRGAERRQAHLVSAPCEGAARVCDHALASRRST